MPYKLLAVNPPLLGEDFFTYSSSAELLLDVYTIVSTMPITGPSGFMILEVFSSLKDSLILSPKVVVDQLLLTS